jgi:outer membrane protein assembly factor BamB
MLTHWRPLAAILLAVATTYIDAGEGGRLVPDWTQWRGPARDGRCEGAAWPDNLDEQHLQLQWRIPLAPSYSGPLIVGDRIFVTETRNEEQEVVSAISRKDGSLLWSANWPGALSVPFFAKANGDWIRSTPAYADGRLYVAGMRDTLQCLDAATGAILWQRDYATELDAAVPSFGCVCSPLVVGGTLYLQAGAGLLKLDRSNGDVKWRVLVDGGGMFGSAFSSPYLTTLAGREHLLVQSRTHLSGVNPDDGGVLWTQEIPAFRGMNIVTPTVFENAVFTSSYGGKSFLYRIASGEQGTLQPQLAWDNKAQGYMCSPVVLDGCAYLHLRNERFTCIDLRTGETKWTTTPFGKYWSLVTQGDRILSLDEDGTLRLIRATPEKFDLLSERKVSEQECWAHLAVAGETVVIRELNGLAVYRWSK